MIPTLKMTLNPIFVLIIITHAQVFETWGPRVLSSALMDTKY